MKESSVKPAKTTTTPKSQDVTMLLRADHKLVSELFAAYEKANSTDKKKKLVAQICKELSVHAQVEEEIFYPALQQALKDKELIPEAIVEHATLKSLIDQVDGIEPEGEMYDAKIKVLSEYVKHHVEEEESEMFPKAKSTSTSLDLKALGAQLMARKAELMTEPA